jgi:hypothetical protein
LWIWAIPVKTVYLMTAKKVILSAFAGLVLLGLAFYAGLSTGSFVTRGSITSELVWYNRGLLTQAIEDMKKGDTAAAEVKIMEVHNRLMDLVEKK